jgi:CDP-diacylglycerol--glycerol-3-phosphate 3-phosphatidyltransferase
MWRDATLNVPNLLSGYRLIVIPVILVTIVLGYREAFFTLVCVSLATDILDGLIARTFRLQTEFGARLDSLADDATYFMTFLGSVVLETDFVWAHRIAFGVLLLFKLIPLSVSLGRFGRSTSMHLYSSRVVGYLQGIFVFVYFLFGFVGWYFYLMIAGSILAACEKLVILLVIPELRSNMRSLYFVLRARPGA